MAEVRAITPTRLASTWPSDVMTSSVIPSLRYSSAGSPLRFVNGKTAIVMRGVSSGGRGGRASASQSSPITAVAVPAANSAAGYERLPRAWAELSACELVVPGKTAPCTLLDTDVRVARPLRVASRAPRCQPRVRIHAAFYCLGHCLVVSHLVAKCRRHRR